MGDDEQWRDKLAIRELLERYMRLNDDGCGNAIAELFDENATMQVMGRQIVGRAAIRAFFRGDVGEDPPRWSEPGQLLKQPGSLHISSNPIVDVDVDVDGSDATAETDFQVVRRDNAGHAFIALIGRYRDRLHRSPDGTWLIVSRTAVSVAVPGEEGTDAEWSRTAANATQ